MFLVHLHAYKIYSVKLNELFSQNSKNYNLHAHKEIKDYSIYLKTVVIRKIKILMESRILHTKISLIIFHLFFH